MSFRGRGRGYGRGGGGMQKVGEMKPYELFPGDVKLPSLPNISAEEKMLITKKAKLEGFWLGSCYHLQTAASKSKEDAEIERYSDKFKQTTRAKREALESYLKLVPLNFPAELIQGSKRLQRDNKKLQWDQGSGEQKLEQFEKLEEKIKGKDGKEGKEKKDESDNEEEQVEEESSDEDDYNQNIDFDDDEDDLNMEEEVDEDCY